jgi:hypothetical protein
VFVLWSQVGGQTHLDPLPWYVKLGLGVGSAFAAVKATAEAVSQDVAWNRGTLKWFSILLGLIAGCGLASLYSHNFLESQEPADEETVTSWCTCPASRTMRAGLSERVISSRLPIPEKSQAAVERQPRANAPESWA